MRDSKPYELLDFGHGRRLERFGELVLDRPCPAAVNFERSDPLLWEEADARFEGRERERGRWVCRRSLPERWTLAHGPLRFELKRTDFGHVGVFPEQAENWQWIADRCKSQRRTAPGEAFSGAGTSRGQFVHGSCVDVGHDNEADSPLPRPRSQQERGQVSKVLNLFAYTGGATMAAAAAGAEVVHVDAAKNVVAWACRNAKLAGLADAPIRWIVEDAQKFVKREIRRGNRYDAVILDPPSYGHGAHGEVWRLAKHLPRLLELCAELTADRLRFLLLTCHTPGFDADMLAAMVRDTLGPGGRIIAQPLTIRSRTGRLLPSGVVVRLES